MKKQQNEAHRQDAERPAPAVHAWTDQRQSRGLHRKDAYSCSSQVMNLGGVIALAVLAAQVLEDQEGVTTHPPIQQIIIAGEPSQRSMINALLDILNKVMYVSEGRF